MRHAFVSGLLPLIGLGAAGCSGNDVVQTGDEANIVANVLANTAEVHEDRLVFPKRVISGDLRKRINRFEATIEGGGSKEDVENVLLVSDRQDGATADDGQIDETVGNPYGFIRRALSVHDEGDSTVIVTETATVEEVYEELEENGQVDVGTDPNADTGASPSGKRLSIPIIDVSGLELYREGDTVVRLPSAYLKFDAALDVGASIGLFKVKEARAILEATVESELTLEGISNQSLQKTVESTAFSGKYPLPALGPIVLTLGVTATVGCEIALEGSARFFVGAAATMHAKAGALYENGAGLDGVWEGPTFTPELIGPELTATGPSTIKCYVRTDLQLLLFDAFGPTITPVVYGKADVTLSPPHATVRAGVTGRVGGAFTIFGKELGKIDKELFAYEKEIWEGTPQQ